MGANNQQGIILFGQGDQSENSVAKLPKDLILDRCLVAGQSTTNTKRGLALNSGSAAVIGCDFAECHGKGFDSQAAGGWNGTGPFLIENNRLEAAGEVIMFGGAATFTGNVPSDITIRRNYLTRPLGWKGVWTVKNLFELKNAQRVLIEENILENHWCCGQGSGASIMFGALDGGQPGGCLWCAVRDVTFRFNLVNNVSGAFNLTDRYGNAPPMVRVQITDNLVTNVTPLGGAPQSRCYILQEAINDLHIARNTCGAPYAYVQLLGAPKARFAFRANAQTSSAGYPWFSSQGQGDASLAANLTAPFVVADNLFIANAPTLVPSGNGNVRLTAAGVIPAGIGVDQAELQRRLTGVR